MSMTPIARQAASHPSRRRVLGAGLGLGMLAPLAALAAEGNATGYPSRQISFIVPFPPGGSVDAMARQYAEPMARILGVPIVVENRPGAGGSVAALAVARAKPDGYTLYFGTAATHGSNAALYKNLPFDVEADFIPVAPIIDVANVLTVNPNVLDVKNLQEFVAAVKANPGKYNYASTGNGAGTHMAFAEFNARLGLNMVHVPYKGAAPALADLMGGQIPLFLDPPPNLIQPAKAGRIRLIGVASDKRLPMLPDVPTFIEQGIPGMVGSTWASMIAPAGTPRDIVKRMSDAVNAIIQSEETKAKLEAMGTFGEGTTPEACDAFLAAETTKWGKVIRDAGVTLD